MFDSLRSLCCSKVKQIRVKEADDAKNEKCQTAHAEQNRKTKDGWENTANSPKQKPTSDGMSLAK